MRRAAVFTLLCLFAGCGEQSSPPARAVDLYCDATRGTVAFHASGSPASAPALTPCRYGTGVRAMEPSFAFARDGRILYQNWVLRDDVAGGAPPYPVVMRSSDGGKSWEDVSPLGHVTTLDPVMLLDERTGRIFSANWLADAQPMGATLSFTDDGGDSWITSPLAGYGFDGQSLGAGPPVTSIPVGYPDLVVGLDGAVYVPKRHDGQPQIAISHDEGLTWTHVQVAANGSSSQANRAAIDAQGGLYYTWTAADHLPYLA